MSFFRENRRIVVMITDMLLCSLSFWLSFYLRFEEKIPHEYIVLLLKGLPVILLIRFTSFLFFGMYRGIWRYASVNDLVNLLKAVVTGTVVFIIFVVFTEYLKGFPRSIFVTGAAFTIVLVGGSRFVLRMYREIFPEAAPRGHARNLLIVGAGDAGDLVLRELRNNPRLNYNVVGLIDDDKVKRGMQIQGVTVLGGRHEIMRICAERSVEEIIIAIPSASRNQMKAILEECERTSARIKTAPALGDLIDGRLNFSQVREVRIDDLLGRDVVEVDGRAIREYLRGKTVLVTGAGGSIGSEICRKLIKFGEVKVLVLMGRGENSIYEIGRELSLAGGANTSLARIIGDVINRKKLEGIFRKYKPQIVFHAGADKHVPLLESNPDEAVLNNIIGTKNVVEVCEEFGAERLVCVSTDKAADPVSVMGCSKRAAEMLVQGRKHPVTKSMMVRFGNVLGSRGSVIPLFKEQILAGGPVTVTHKDMVRYFMTIPEAARLVLQAGAIGQGGDVFLLDMGNPVRITELAKQMIRLSGFEPDEDIKIEFTGLRPGERLEETLTGKGEKLARTSHPKILEIQFPSGNPALEAADLEELTSLAIGMDAAGIIKKLRKMVPNYTPE